MFDRLYAIAKQSLEGCFVDGKVVASPTHFSDFWARDTFFAVPGLLAIGEYDRVKESLIYFLELQNTFGGIPRKVAVDINSIKYITGRRLKRKSPKPVYIGIVPGFPVMDANALCIIAAGNYLGRTRDYDFADLYYRRLQCAVHFYDEHVREGFVHESGLAGWMDTIFKSGSVLYTNILYMQALEAMVMIAQVAGHDDEAEVYVHKARGLKKRIAQEFWHEDEGYFVDQLGESSNRIFDTAGNLLAITSGIANASQATSILSGIGKQETSWISAVPTGHSWHKINPVLTLLGMRDYHTSTHWSWIGALYVRALALTGDADQAIAVLTDYQSIFEGNDGVGETYDPDGKSYKRFLWKSAIPFAWSSGMMIESLVALGLQGPDDSYEVPEQRIC